MRNILKLHAKKFISLGVLLLLWSVFFYKILFLGENIYCCDNNLINIPSNVFLASQLKLGHFPLWNPYLFSGIPFVADINLSPFYPMNLLYLFLSPFRALSIGMIVNVFIGLVGMYWCARKLNISRSAAVFSATVFGFSGTMIVYAGNSPMLQVASLLPWVFGFWVLYVEEPTRKRLAMVSSISALQVFAGHPQLTFFTALLCGMYSLVMLPGGFYNKMKIILPVGILAVFLSGVQLLPFLEYASHSTRLSQGFSYSATGALPISSIVRLLLPTIVGDQRVGTDWWQGGTVFGYVGILSFLFVIAALKKNRRVLFFAIAAIFTWLGAFGDKTPVFYFLYYIVPGISLFRVPGHLLLLGTFSIAVLVGMGVDSLSLKRFSKIRLDQISMILIIMGGFLFLIYRYIGEDAWPFMLTVPRLGEKFRHLTVNGFHSLLYILSFNLLFIGLSLRTFSLVLKREFKHRMKMILLLLLFSDLFLYSRLNLLTVKYTQTDQWEKESSEISYRLKSLLGESYRLYIDPSLYPSKILSLQETAKYVAETTWQRLTFRPNIPMHYGIPLVDGYASIISRDYQRYFNVPSLDPTGINIGSMNNPKLNAVAAGFILIPHSKQFDPTNFVQIMNTDQFVVVKNLKARPIISLETGAGTPSAIPFVVPYPGEIVALSDASQAATLVVAQQNYSGWKAFVDDKPTSIVPYEGMLQSIAVPPGNHTIRLTYLPYSLVVGMLLSVLGLMISSALWLWPHVHS